ncbi:hypothetical protein [Haliangium ochraceum]|nr:hypothetical protein [Haliangium ochraceum]
MGCSDPSPPSMVDAMPAIDAGDAGGPGGSAGLAFHFASAPSLPGDAGGKYDALIEDARFGLVQVRAIGDSATGENTSRDSFDLAWTGGGGEDELSFPQAPPGIYAQLLAEVIRYDIYGTLELDSGRVPFRLSQENSAGIALSVSLGALELEPNMDRVVEIAVNIDDIVDAIDWDEVAPDEAGRLRVGGSSPQGGELHEAIADSFGDDDGSLGVSQVSDDGPLLLE